MNFSTSHKRTIIVGRRQAKRERAINRRTTVNSLFHRDLIAMTVVWRMLKKGSVKWIGEIGRQY